MYHDDGAQRQSRIHVREEAVVRGFLPAHGLAEHLSVEGDDYQRRLPARTPAWRAARLFAGGAVDETTAAVEWRAIEASGGLELGPLGGNKIL